MMINFSTAVSRNHMTHCRALKDFPDASQVSLHKNNKIKQQDEFLQLIFALSSWQQS
jgi:hypothetical protein